MRSEARADFAKEFGVSRETCTKLQTYVELLVAWQRRVNLVGARTLPHVWDRHIRDSAQLLPLVGHCRRLVDIGSGAGFPGLVLAILGVSDVYLVESHSKKAEFLREVIRQTGASACLLEQRAETVRLPGVGVVTARAVAPLPKLVFWAAPILGPRGICIFPKGRNVDQELALLPQSAEIKVVRIVPSLTDRHGRIVVMAREQGM